MQIHTKMHTEGWTGEKGNRQKLTCFRDWLCNFWRMCCSLQSRKQGLTGKREKDRENWRILYVPILTILFKIPSETNHTTHSQHADKQTGRTGGHVLSQSVRVYEWSDSLIMKYVPTHKYTESENNSVSLILEVLSQTEPSHNYINYNPWQ